MSFDFIPPLHAAIAPPTSSPRVRRHPRLRQQCGRHIRLLTQANLYQLRVYSAELYLALNYSGSVNCGFFRTLNRAKEARDRLSELLLGESSDAPIVIWRAVSKLQDAGVIPIGKRGRILPTFVVRVGDQFRASLSRGQIQLESRLYDNPEDAHLELWSALKVFAVAAI